MTPIMHQKADDDLSSIINTVTMTSSHYPTRHHQNRRKRKPARCPFFANPIKLGIYLSVGLNALLYGALQMLVAVHHSTMMQTNNNNTDILQGDGIWSPSLPTLLLFGPKYNAIAMMKASKKQFVNQNKTKRAKHPTVEMGLEDAERARLIPTNEVAPHANTKPVNPPSATTSSKDPPRTMVQIEYAHATPSKRKVRPVKSKTPEATRKDWQTVMREQPVYESIPSSPLNVGLITANGIKGPTQHVFLDGIHGSDFLKLEVLCDVKQHNCTSALDYPNVNLWMVDGNSAKHKPSSEDIFHQIVAMDDPSFRIVFVDYSDRLVLRKGLVDTGYFDIDEERLLAPHIRYALRCIDKYRRWATNKGYVSSGRLVHPMWDEMLITKGGPPLHTPFAVRTDIVNAIHKLLPSIAHGPKKDASGASCPPWPYHPVDCIPDRPMDLIHLWKVIETDNGLLRNLATEKVETMRTWKHPVENRMLRVETAIQGNRAHAGRRSVSDDYVRALLQTKIVVVTQVRSVPSCSSISQHYSIMLLTNLCPILR